MSWSVYSSGNVQGVKQKVVEILGGYGERYLKNGTPNDLAEASQVLQVRDLIVAQLDRSPSKFVNVEASGSHNASFSSVSIKVEQVHLDIV